MEKTRMEQRRDRYRTIAFRCSDEERHEIEMRVELSGLQKQDYLLKSVLYQKIAVVGNELLFEKLYALLSDIREELQRLDSASELDTVPLVSLRTATELLSGITEEIQY